MFDACKDRMNFLQEVDCKVCKQSTRGGDVRPRPALPAKPGRRVERVRARPPRKVDILRALGSFLNTSAHQNVCLLGHPVDAAVCIEDHLIARYHRDSVDR